MKTHTRNYLEGMKIPKTQFFEDMGIICEFCEERLAVDINHLQPRGMGGSKLRDTVENLIALCRLCHSNFEGRKLDREAMKEKHLKNIPHE